MVVDMTGGTEGPNDALDRLSAAGVGTLVGMHYSEEHRKRAEELKLNLVIAGHISSDVLGMNLVLDAIEAPGTSQVVCTSRHGAGQAHLAPSASLANEEGHPQGVLLRAVSCEPATAWAWARRCRRRRSSAPLTERRLRRLDRRILALGHDEHDLAVLGALADDRALRLVRPRVRRP